MYRAIADRCMVFLFITFVTCYTLIQIKLGYTAKYKQFGNFIPKCLDGTDILDETVKRMDFKPTCSDIPAPSFRLHGDTWQAVSEGGDVFLYSAFHDVDTVRVIGLKKKAVGNMTCQLWYKNETLGRVTMDTTSARKTTLPGGDFARYRTVYVVCDVKQSLPPFAVSIVDGNSACRHPTNVFHVHTHQPANAKRFKFTVCVPPVRDNYPTPHRLVEWIKMNKLLGVEYFTFYNESMNSRVAYILKAYEEQGFVEILAWNRPIKDVHYGAQLASMHDCLHRHKGQAAFTAFLDVDEFIIPRNKDDLTWTDMFKRLPVACSYSFRSSFFIGNYSEDTESVDRHFIEGHSYVLNRLKRHSRIFPHHVRSKVIVKPQEISSFSVHITYACKHQQTIHLTEPDIGLVHHYRNEPAKHMGEVWDNTTLKFGTRLIERLHKVVMK